MIITTSTPEFHSTEEDKPEIIVVRYEPGPKTKGKFTQFIRRPLKWFGILSTLLIGAAAVAPDVFGVPLNLRPWVFLTSIFWVITFCAGFFNL